jgi:hypothetical protein
MIEGYTNFPRLRKGKGPLMAGFGVRVERRRFAVGASPTRQPLQSEATGAVMEVTKWLSLWLACHALSVTTSLKIPVRLYRGEFSHSLGQFPPPSFVASVGGSAGFAPLRMRPA